MSSIQEFLTSLERASMPSTGLVNIYGDSGKRENLTCWLERRGHERPTTLFVGEAPGKDGAAITGVPFVSPDVLMNGPKRGDPWGAFGTGAGYRRMTPGKEGTATMFWEVVARYLGEHPYPVTWNTVPFWPVEGAGGNRTPSTAEQQFGSEWLRQLVAIYPEASIVAVGNKAHEACRRLGQPHLCVPHPANGHKEAFEKGVRDIAGSLSS